MTTNDQEATGEVAVVDKVDTAAVVQIVAASNERLNEMEKLKRKLNTPTGASTNPKNFNLNKNLNMNLI